MKKKKLILNKPIYLGFSILEISKEIFYSNFYDGYRRQWPSDRMKLLMCDTDSYIMEVTMPRHETVYDDLLKIRKQGPLCKLTLDCSSYDRDDEDDSIRRLYSAQNARVLGAVKDELGSTIPIAFVGVRPKAYAILSLERKSYTVANILKAKGCPKSVLKRSCNFDLYERMVRESKKSFSADITMIRSEKHSLNTIVSRKKCLTIADDKRFISDSDHITTFAFGHKRFRASDSDNDEGNV